MADDLARVVDAKCAGGPGGQGIIDDGKRATAEQKAVDGAAGFNVLPGDLARVVDAKRLGGKDQGNVKSAIAIDWHDTGSSVIVSLAESLDRKAEPVSKRA